MIDGLTSIYTMENKASLALPLQQESANRAKSNDSRCEAYNSLTRVLVKLERLQEADDSADVDEKACKAAGDNYMLADLMVYRTRIKMRQNALPQAMAYAKEAQNLLETALAHMEPNDINKRAYSLKVSDVYDRMIAILMKEKRYDEAMAASEQARARAFPRPAVYGASEEGQQSRRRRRSGWNGRTADGCRHLRENAGVGLAERSPWRGNYTGANYGHTRTLAIDVDRLLGFR